MVKDVNGQIFREGVEVRRRRAEYFEQILNVADAGTQISMQMALAAASVGRFE